MKKYDITAIDLFSGAGGFSFGLHESGVKTVAAVEIDKFAAETFSLNLPNTRVLQADIHDFTDAFISDNFSDVDLVVGGPPCQGFSVAGPFKFGIRDKRNDLVLQYLRFISIIKPKICIIENVKNFVNGKLVSKDDDVLRIVMTFLEENNYQANIKILFAPNFGVPQSRTRVFIIAIRKDTNINFPIIHETHGEGKQPWVTVDEAINDLPFVKAGEGSDFEPEKLKYRKKNPSEYQKLMRTGTKGIYNHIAMKHTDRLIERFKHIPQGGSLLDVPPEHGQRIRNGSKLDGKPRFKMNNQRLSPDEICWCVTASFQSTFVHPYFDRNLTAREGARLQSFPDKFIFKGPRTLMSKKLLEREGRDNEIGLSQYNQIGNAVPPLIGQAIGKAIIKSLKKF